MKKENLMRILRLFLVLLAILSLLYPALINGFPLIYSDSGTYIAAFPARLVPVDRPIGYSIFIQLSSLTISLWLVIIAQAIILYYLIFLIYRDVVRVRDPFNWCSGTIILLSITTGLSNYASQLMPDIFVSIMVFVTMILLLRKQSSRLSLFFLFIIFQFSVISHYSNLLIATMLLVVVIVLNIRWKVCNRAGIKFLLSFIISGWLLIPLINKACGGEFTMARTSNIALTGRLIEDGLLIDYLHENCGTKDYILCPYKDSLASDIAYFAWNEKSVLYKGDCIKKGWGQCWIEKDPEFGALIKDILSTPRYFLRFMQMSFKGFKKQLPDFGIGMLDSMPAGSPPWMSVNKYYPGDLAMYEAAGQFKKTMFFPNENLVQRIMVYCSLLFLIVTLFIRRTRKLYAGELGLMVLLVILCILFNAVICGTLSSPVDRYEARIIWLLPFVACIFISEWYKKEDH